MLTRHFLLVVAAATLWGTGGLLGALLAETSPMSSAAIAMWRMLIAGGVLALGLLISRRLHVRSLTWPQWRRALATGGLTAIFEVLYFTGIDLAGVGLATLVAIGSAPMWVMIANAAAGRAKPTRVHLAALALALVGLMALLGSSLGASGEAVWGVAVSLLTGAAFAGVTLVNRVPVPGLGAPRLTALSFTAGGLMLVPVALVAGWGMPTGVEGWSYALALGVFSTALAYVCYLGGLVTVPPFVATVISLLEPLVAAVAGALVLSERIGPWGIAGGLALATAVVLLRPQRDEPASIH